MVSTIDMRQKKNIDTSDVNCWKPECKIGFLEATKP